MRILHTADWHLGKTLEGRDRQSEQIHVMNEICEIADDQKIDLVLIAGDIYQTVNPPAWAENLFYETINRLSNNGNRGVVVISGNHDQPERIRAANPLADKQGIYLIGLPNDQLQPNFFKSNQKTHALNGGTGWLEIAIPSTQESAALALLPYPSESRLKQLFIDSNDNSTIREAYSQYVGKWLNLQKSNFSEQSINIAMSHIFVQGGLPTESEIEIQLGGAYTVDPQHIPDNYQYVALGHLHRAQDVKGTASLTRYSGSPLAYSFSEAKHKKSVTIVDIKKNEPAKINEVLLKSGKPLIKKKIANGIIELEDWLNNEGQVPAWIDIELNVPHPLSIEEIQRIRKMHDGLINIKIVTPTLEQIAQSIKLQEQTPIKIFERFYEFKTGAKPRKEVVDLFGELFQTEMEEGDESE